MPIFNISKNGDLNQITEKNFLIEKDIQKIVERNIETIFSLKFIASEYVLHNLRLDSLAFDTETSSFLECNLFKNRLLKMYRILEQKALDPKTSGTETAKCCEVAASIAINIIWLEAEALKAVKNGLVSIGEAAVRTVANKKGSLNNLRNSNNDNDSDESFKEYDPNRKF